MMDDRWSLADIEAGLVLELMTADGFEFAPLREFRFDDVQVTKICGGGESYHANRR